MQMPAKRYFSGWRFVATLIALASLLITGCASVSEQPVAPISDVVSLAESGASSEIIIGQINASRTVYALRGSDFAKLSERGVPDDVLDALQNDFFSSVENLTNRWYRSRERGGPTSIYPQPLDLDNLDQGGNGMGPTTNLGQETHGSRPVGVPAWVPPFPADTTVFISPVNLLEWANSGMAGAEMVEKINNSRVRPVYAAKAGGARARTGAITGSMYAGLAKQGVPLEALDALQAIYIADHVEAVRVTARGAN